MFRVDDTIDSTINQINNVIEKFNVHSEELYCEDADDGMVDYDLNIVFFNNTKEEVAKLIKAINNIKFASVSEIDNHQDCSYTFYCRIDVRDLFGL